MAYFDAKQIVQRGTRITSSGGDRMPPVMGGERLVGVLDNGLWAIAPDVTSERKYNYFYDCYSKGDWLTMHVYALPEGEIENCADQGRVPVAELTRILSEHPPKTETRY